MADKPDYMSKNETQQMGNAGFQAGKLAVTGAKATAKVAAQNYVGAAKDVVVSYSKEIFTVLVALIMVIVILFVSIFNSGPAMVMNGVEDWIDDQTTKLTFHQAQRTIAKQIKSAEDDCYKKIIKKIENGYIPDFKKKFNSDYFDDESVKTNGYLFEEGSGDTPNKYYSLRKEKDTNNLLFIYTVGAPLDENPVTRIVRIKDAYNTENNSLDTLYFVLAFSIYHQNNDVGSYKDKDDGKEYNEPQGENKQEERWNEITTKGLKKFLKSNKSKIVSPKFSATKENIELTLEGTDVTRTAEVLNVSIHTINASDTTTINDMFKLSKEEINDLDGYYDIANELFKSE